MSRREEICDAVLDLAATGGNRAVTHRAVDTRLRLSAGSTSYYYRTRSELLAAAIEHLARASRAANEEGLAVAAGPLTVDGAAQHIATQLDLLAGSRRRDALARYALAPDAVSDPALHAALATCLFSLPSATGLLEGLGASAPERAAADLLSLLEGLLFDRLYGTRSLHAPEPGTRASRSDLETPIVRWLTALAAS
ncbi:TetR family transcriptional regulator [Tsukamurella sp. 8F]|uniref:TetR/AcrR family transcriptional regulator n=1 Tax=unclassified Tsukamurella TaxID=2633480 RepID=UPI0023B89272|nr:MULTISPECIES: TetR family transcriptional regulator [unclassified Tsukamurella]MDF0530566.1 TetR family transcriptional regulator [Tsukamurella sp. 8J]MDF0586784.1 TetR family transcriptional regulator [Tsukamurella sp. 8F]